MSKEFLVAYDYGTGGAWAIIKADFETEITQRYPELTIVTHRPDWMDDETYARIKDSSQFDIKDPPQEFLAELVKSRDQTT